MYHLRAWVHLFIFVGLFVLIIRSLCKLMNMSSMKVFIANMFKVDALPPNKKKMVLNDSMCISWFMFHVFRVSLLVLIHESRGRYCSTFHSESKAGFQSKTPHFAKSPPWRVLTRYCWFLLLTTLLFTVSPKHTFLIWQSNHLWPLRIHMKKKTFYSQHFT